MRAKKRRVSVLDKKSTQIINDVIACLRIPENQERYNQGEWIKRHIVTWPQSRKHTVCGTEGCLAGWVVFVAKPRVHNKLEKIALLNRLKKADLLYGQQHSIPMEASELMRLKNGELADTGNLFGLAEHWPSPFYWQWGQADTKQKQVAVAIERLKHFKFTGE